MLALKVLVAFVFLLLAGGGRWALQVRPSGDEAPVKEVLLLPPGKVLRSLDLGHHTLAADLLFIRANLYYGHHLLTDEQLPWLSDFIDILIQLDPDFKKAYIWGSMVTLYPKRQVDYLPPELVSRANRFLQAGLQRFPEDHRFPMRLAFNYYYELGDKDRAIPYFERAAETPGAPRWLKQKLADLYSKKGQMELAQETILQLIAEEEDPVLSDALKRRLESVMGKESRERLMAVHQELVQRWRDEYGFVPLDLYLLVREP